MEATIEGMTLEEKLGQLFLPMAVEALEDVLAKYDRMGLQPERPRVCRGLTAAANAIKENLSARSAPVKYGCYLKNLSFQPYSRYGSFNAFPQRKPCPPQDKYNKTDTKFIEKFSFS